MSIREINFDGIVGPSHNYAGLSFGNLASTKNAGQRIYVSSGIYAEATLFYRDGGFQGLAYTYPDYLWPATREFFLAVRERYLSQLR